MRTFALFGAKDVGYFEIYDVSALTRRDWASADIFRIREEGLIFCDFLRTTFMDGPLFLLLFLFLSFIKFTFFYLLSTYIFLILRLKLIMPNKIAISTTKEAKKNITNDIK